MNKPMLTDGLERHRFTTADIDRMIAAGILDAEGRWELIDGEIVPMAAQYVPHGDMTIRLAVHFYQGVDRSKFKVLTGVTVELNAGTRVDPDICVFEAGVAAKIVPARATRLVIEVSDATRRKDLKIKAPLYAAAGIPEYWVIDLDERVTHIHRGPSAQGWLEAVRVIPFAESVAPEMFPALSIKLD